MVLKAEMHGPDPESVMVSSSDKPCLLMESNPTLKHVKSTATLTAKERYSCQVVSGIFSALLWFLLVSTPECQEVEEIVPHAMFRR
jgi:hypothetical protein